MKSVSVGIDPDHIGFELLHRPPLILLCDSRNADFFVNNPTWKMKLVSVGNDPDHIGIIADNVSAELFDSQ